ncbi:hypothetical protein GS504_15630 [Rhodococcus hoagii]|nr:hypothetical protein [Prescottella equi]NKS58889.1 hypothetical protein [Prescottella equi]NKS69080.1 hypothetical protein [Prescottella equi]
MSLTRRRILDALARHIAATGLARYNPDGIYSASTVPAIFVGQMPPTPDAALLLNIYNDSRDRDPDRANPDIWVQLRGRTPGRDPRTTDDLLDALFDVLDNARHYVMPGGVRVAVSQREVTATADPDENGRYTRPDSYKFHLNPSE